MCVLYINKDDDSDKINVEDCDKDVYESINEEEYNFEQLYLI